MILRHTSSSKPVQPAGCDPTVGDTGACAHARAREGGFTVLEMVIVTVILMIIMAVIILSFRGAKESTYRKETLSAAAVYAQAISQYKVDHANRLPAAADMLVVAGQPAGPKNLLGKPYVSSIPSGVTDGRIEVSMACGAPGGASSLGSISYCPSGNAYSMEVRTRPSPSEPWEPPCYVGGKQPAC